MSVIELAWFKTREGEQLMWMLRTITLFELFDIHFIQMYFSLLTKSSHTEVKKVRDLCAKILENSQNPEFKRLITDIQNAAITRLNITNA